MRRTLFHDFVGLFLPRRCSACDGPLMRFEEALCLGCAEELPRTRFHDDEQNRVERLFQGKLRVEAASAFLHFSTDGMVQRMLHRLKYRGDDAVGKELGRRMARDLMGSRRFADVDVAIAVPLHPKKLHQRGYNQAQLLVDGMREEWPLKNVDDRLLRIVSTSTQTRRGRLDRWQNVRTAFAVENEEALTNAHVLLVDDVITTGATIEACARALESVPGVRISVFACACA